MLAPVNLTAEISVISPGEGGESVVDVIARRDFALDFDKAYGAKAWAMRHFRKELRGIRDDQVVRADITGSSADGYHCLVCGSTSGWKGEIRLASGVFE